MGTTAEEIARALFGLAVPAQPRLRVPGNLVGVIRGVERRTGVPFEIIAGVIQTEFTTGTSGDWSEKITPLTIVQVAKALQDEADDPKYGHRATPNWRVVARHVFGEDRPSWLDRFDSIVYARDKISGKPDTGRPEWIEREPTPYTLRDKRGLTRDDWENLLKRGQVTPDQFVKGLVGMGYDEDDARVIYSLQGKFGLSAQERRMAEPTDIYDIYDLFQKILGRAPSGDAEAVGWGRVGQPYGEVLADILASPEATQWREKGPQIQQTRRWADSIWMDYYGRSPTNAEVAEIVSRGHTPDSLRRYLSDQPSGSTTLGELRSVREIADRYALEHVGRRADEGEVNYLITSKITTPEAVSAFYQQLKQRIDTGDPNFAWATDPKSWRAAQAQLQSLWQRAGMMGEIDPHLVNRSVSEKWDAQAAQDYIDALPAPGFEGVTVGEARRVRSIAEPWKEQYLPGQKLTKEEVRLFLGKNSQDIRRYYRSLPVSMRRDFKPNDRTARINPIIEGAPASAETPKPAAQVDTSPVPNRGRPVDVGGGTTVYLQPGQTATVDDTTYLPPG